ncbi:MAG: ABC transporter permease [Lachnospiraceae bacterium]|nr:ABC transporter permease [Lachnospiraceae bacterium]
MSDVIVLNLFQFGAVYLLLLIVLGIMKKCKINQSKLLVIGSIRMTVQLVLAGFVLTYLFKNPHPVFVIIYLILMIGMAIHTVLSRNKGINSKFSVIVAVSLSATGLLVIAFFILGVVGVSFFNPQYTIPISGMIIGNAMTGVSLGLKTFNESIKTQKMKIDTLINIGATPKSILIPFVNKALETALLPTLNSMVGMGVISLPGMMTGQILSGTLPTTAILYQIAIMIAITVVTCLAVFCSLFFGYRTLYNSQNQMLI